MFKNTDYYTSVIFVLACREDAVEIDNISEESIERLCGGLACGRCGGLCGGHPEDSRRKHAHDENEFVENVMQFAENFTNNVQKLIGDLAAKSMGLSDERRNEDIKELTKILSWEYDPTRLDELARYDWRSGREKNEKSADYMEN